ncbi:MAG: nuclear transport factor 2 family protein [Vicinamibacterales bacterium]
MANVGTVQRIYECFGRGDVAGVLDQLADDVEWEYGVNSTDVPWLQPRRGRADVANFFQALGALEFHRFQPTAFLEADTIVVALVDLEATVRATGRRLLEEDEVHIWHFDPAGKVRKFRHRADTHQHWAALTGR